MLRYVRRRKCFQTLLISALVIASMACGLLSDTIQPLPDDARIIEDEVLFPNGGIEFLFEIMPFGTIEVNNRRHMIRCRFYLSDSSVDNAGDFYTEHLSDWQIKKDMAVNGHRHLLFSSDHPLSWVFTEAEFNQRLSQVGYIEPGLLDLEVAHSPAHHGVGRSSFTPDRLPDGTIIIVVDYLFQDLQETPTADMETPTALETAPTGDLGQACQRAIATSLCTNPYFPPIEGLKLVYEIDGHRIQTRQISQIQTGVQEPGALPMDSFVVTLIDDNINVDMEYLCTEEGLVGGDIGRMMVSVLEGQDMGDEGVSFESMTFKGVMLPNQVSPGDTWQASVEVVLSAPDGVKLIATNRAWYRFDGYETVMVPGGTFDTLKIVADMVVDVGALLPDGHFMPLTSTQILMVSYYAECIGMVMSESDVGLMLVDVIMP